MIMINISSNNVKQLIFSYQWKKNEEGGKVRLRLDFSAAEDAMNRNNLKAPRRH